MEPPPAVSAGGAGTQAAAAAVVEEKAAKRARKRSRYLGSDYVTATLDADDHGDDVAASPGKGKKDAAALLLRLQEADLAAADLLAALLRLAASPGDSSPGTGVDAGVLLGFFALHRASALPGNCRFASTTTTTDHHHSEVAAAAAAGHMHVLPNTCHATALAADGSVGKKQDDAVATGHAYAAHDIGPANALAEEERKRKKKKNNKEVTLALDACNATADDCSAQPAASSAMGHAFGHQIGPAAAPEAGPKRRRRRRRKKMASPLDAHNAAAAAACSAQPATGSPGIANSVPKKKVRNRFGRGQHAGKPVALLLDFPKGRIIDPPSKEDLLSTFRGFGSLNEAETDIGTRHARLVFQSSAAGEAAYSCAHTLGTFTARRLQYLRPRPLPPKIPLTDVRKNLEKMIASLTGPSVLDREGALDLAGQMLCLMAKVDKTLCAAGAGHSSATATAHPH